MSAMSFAIIVRTDAIAVVIHSIVIIIVIIVCIVHWSLSAVVHACCAHCLIEVLVGKEPFRVTTNNN